MKHRKITAIVMALCVLVTLIVVPVLAETEELVADGSFETWGETGAKGDEWRLVYPGNGNASLIEVTNEDASDGDYSMKLISTLDSTSARKGVFVNIGSFEQDTTVKVSLKVNAETLNGSGKLIVRLQSEGGFYHNNSEEEAFPIQTITEATDGWVQLTTWSTMDSYTANKDLYVGFETNSTSFEIYLDEFSAEVGVVEEVPEYEEEPKELVEDGSFEKWGKTGTMGDAWSLLDSDTLMEVTNEDASDGDYSMKMTSTLDSTSSRKGVFVNIGSFEEGEIVRVSLKVKAKRLDNYGRLIVRFESSDGEVYNNSEGEAFPIQKITKATGEWVQLITQSTMDSYTAGKDLYVGFETFSTDFEFYLDEFSAETPDISLINGDFENGLTGWTPEYMDGAIELIKEGNNSYVKLSDPIGGISLVKISQLITGLDATKTYKISLDVLSPATDVVRPVFNGWTYENSTRPDDYYGFAYVGNVHMFSELTTYGKWACYQLEFTGEEEFELVLMCISSVNDTVAGYACFDNIVIEEVVDDGNLISNGSFESGRNGLGQFSGQYGITSENYGCWKFGEYGNSTKYSQSTDSIDGKYSLKVNRLTSSEAATLRRENISFDVGATYLCSVYVKNISLTEGTTVLFYGSNRTEGQYVEFGLEKLPANEWVCLQFLYTADAATGDFDVRVPIGTGVALIDNVSIRKLDKAYATYADADGCYSASLVDGGKATITMPAAQGDEGNIIALALYKGTEDEKTLMNVKVNTITEADTVAGYAQLTLAADLLGADFANVNFAKLIMLKRDTYEALQKYELLLKAAQ